MRRIEYAVDIWDLRGLDPRLNAKALLEHLNAFATEGWELVWMGLNVDLADHDGPCHLQIFKRILDEA